MKYDKLTKNNYRAWNIKVNDFPKKGSIREKIIFLLGFAVLAPSTHNSQPWHFSVKDNFIIFRSEESRILNFGDPKKSFLYISLGAAIENILVAADYFGLKTKLELEKKEKYLCGKIIFEDDYFDLDLNINHPIFAIKKRCTNRGKYKKKKPTKFFLDYICNLSNENVKVEIILDEDKRKEITEIQLKARNDFFEDKNFRKELASYKRNNLTRQKTGIPGFTMGFSLFKSFGAPLAIRFFNVMKLAIKEERVLMNEYTPVFVVITTKNDDYVDYFLAGRILQKIALQSEVRGLSTAFQAIPSRFSDYKKILDTEYNPQIFSRLGYSLKSALYSPRLLTDDVCI